MASNVSKRPSARVVSCVAILAEVPDESVEGSHGYENTGSRLHSPRVPG